MLMPSHAKNVNLYQEPEPLFTRHKIESQLNAMFSPYVTLRSGGYLVINQTEALVAVDVNSGKSTREFSIEETALNTNLEAADEIARQLKLRDLAGLIVVDFIDMEEKRNNRAVERRLKEALRHDRARIQVGRISHFGLLEMSRQRLRTGVLEGSTSQCPHCQGTGIIRSTESVALAVLRGLEDAIMAGARTPLVATTTPSVALYILNNKRPFINDMEARHGLPITVTGSDKLAGANFTIEKGAAPSLPQRRTERAAVNMDWGFDDEAADGEAEAEEPIAVRQPARGSDTDADQQGDGSRRRRRRRRRGGARRGDRPEAEGASDDWRGQPDRGMEMSEDGAERGADDAAPVEVHAEALDESREQPRGGDERGGQRSRRRGRRGGRRGRERRAAEEHDDANRQPDVALSRRAYRCTPRRILHPSPRATAPIPRMTRPGPHGASASPRRHMLARMFMRRPAAPRWWPSPPPRTQPPRLGRSRPSMPRPSGRVIGLPPASRASSASWSAAKPARAAWPRTLQPRIRLRPPARAGGSGGSAANRAPRGRSKTIQGPETLASPAFFTC